MTSPRFFVFLFSAMGALFAVHLRGNTVTVDGEQILFNGSPTKLLGLRCSNALISDRSTDELIAALDLYRSYGLNTVSVFVMGSRFGDVKGYQPDATLNPVHRARLKRLLEATDRRDMITIVGCLYWGTSRATEELSHWTQEDANRAVANTARWLGENGFHHTILDPDNEGMAGRENKWQTEPMILAAKAANPTLIVANNTRKKTQSEDLNMHFGPRKPGKPWLDSESTPATEACPGSAYWGSYSRTTHDAESRFYNYSRIGAYTEEMKQNQFEVTRDLMTRHSGVLFASTWLQCGPDQGIGGPFTSLGGLSRLGSNNDESAAWNQSIDRVHADAGIRWWLEYVRDHFGTAPPAVADPVESTPALTTFMRDGGWCWYQDPRAIIAHGKLIVSGVSGQSGDVKVSVYDLAARRDLGTVVLHAKFQTDDHDVPALYARPDGSLLAVYAKHGNERIHYSRISDPKDYLQWGPEQQFVHDYDAKPGVTYMNLHSLEPEGLLYNFFRDGQTYNPSFITSADHGQTWGNRTHFISDEVEGRQRPYARYLQRDAHTVGITFTDAHPRNFGNSIYYADYRNGAFYRVDGSKIKALSAGPLTTSEAEKIYQGSGIKTNGAADLSAPNSAWTSSASVDAAGYPHIGYTLYLSNDDHRYRLASWDGTRWHDREIAYAGRCLYPRESSYTGLVTLDPSDPRRVFISTDVDPTTGKDLGGTHEIYTATLGLDDDTSSIQWRALTARSPERNIRPVVATGDGYRAVLWLAGPWRTYTDYESNVIGYIEALD